MAVLTHEEKDRILDEFLGGISAECICRDYNITPLQLVEIFNSTERSFVNELFDEPEKPKLTISQVEYENSQLKEQHDLLNRKINEYEIEIRVHKEMLETLIANNAKKWKLF
ncbi:hypothetical protein [Thorsellia anophelis]|uniref:Uncharacterized protein n=1 Tax=Thorsellia anophelis DSM 18579 TaxID=1123402 RepID=A0A1H9YFG9_9GAMM|nr:hypothetical protein [Thorsellia anophelis]SES67717.1 hypothetical protein SAMN02583745_00235 [Thorsellia anophelis DSM 18579]